MRKKLGLLGLLLAASVFLAACSGSGSLSMGSGATTSPSSTPSGTAPITLTMRDAAPTGVTVLSFEVTVTAAQLQPGNVPLLTSPIDIEIKRLETETAVLNTANVPAGTYTSISVTFSNPELTIQNNSGRNFGTCLNGSVCELRPSLTQATVTYSAAPFPITVMANSPQGLLLDFDLTNAIQTDLSINPSAITFSLLPTAAAGDLDEIEDVVGRVVSKDSLNNRFVLRTESGDLTIQVDANTRFEDFNEAGMANGFASLQPTQIVEVDLRLLAGGTLLARKVELQETEPQGELEGTIVSVDSSTEFRMVVIGEAPDALAVQVGNQIAVQFGSNTSFRIDEDDLDIPSDLHFSSATDLLVGQNVQVRPMVTAAGPSGLTVQTNQIRLRMSRLTARISAKSGSNFTVSSLPSLFTTASPPINQIDVRTSSQTDFENVSGVAALNVGDTVSLRGLLFKTTATPVLLAKKVIKR